MPDFGGPGGPRASERRDPGLLQVDKALQVVRSHLPVQVQRGARQADGAQRLPTHLCHAGKHVLDARALVQIMDKGTRTCSAPAEFTQPEQLPRFRTEFAPEFPDPVGRTALCECDA